MNERKKWHKVRLTVMVATRPMTTTEVADEIAATPLPTLEWDMALNSHVQSIVLVDEDVEAAYEGEHRKQKPQVAFDK